MLVGAKQRNLMLLGMRCENAVLFLMLVKYTILKTPV